MTTYNLGATLAGTTVPFVSGTQFNFESTHTLQVSAVCNPSVVGKIGWFPEITAPGYCLPGEALPTCILTVRDATGATISDLNLPQVYLVADTLHGRYQVGSTLANKLTVVRQLAGQYLISGTLPSIPMWVKLRVIINELAFDLPLWPVGCPVYVLRSGSPAKVGATYADNPFISNIKLTPYLSRVAHTVTSVYTSANSPDFTLLSVPVDPASFFIQTTASRNRYNALTLSQGNVAKCFLRPTWDATTQDFKLAVLPRMQSDLDATQLSLDLLASAPVVALQGNNVVNAFGSVYDATISRWKTSLIVTQ